MPAGRIAGRMILWAMPVLAGCAASPEPAEGFAAPQALPGVANFGVVADGLWRGARPSREGLLRLQAMGVRTIVNLEQHHDDPVEVPAPGVAYYKIPMDAADPDADKLAAFLKIVLSPANRPVFVHCRRGADRTGCAVGTYRIVVQGASVSAALRELAAYRWDPIYRRIPEFLRQLDPADLWLRAARARPEPTVGPARGGRG